MATERRLCVKCFERRQAPQVQPESPFDTGRRSYPVRLETVLEFANSLDDGEFEAVMLSGDSVRVWYWVPKVMPVEADDSVAPGDLLAALGADYQILVVARGWPHREREAYCDALLDIWGERVGEAVGYPSVFGILYEPGDYARAAEKIEEVRGGD